MVRSGQSVQRAHSEQAVVAHACHGHMYRLSPVPLSGTGKKRGGDGVSGDYLHWQVQGSTSSPTGIGSRQRCSEVLWNLECPVGQNRNMCAFGWSAEK